MKDRGVYYAAYRQAHKDKLKTYIAAYRKKNRTELNAKLRAARAERKAAGICKWCSLLSLRNHLVCGPCHDKEMAASKRYRLTHHAKKRNRPRESPDAYAARIMSDINDTR